MTNTVAGIAVVTNIDGWTIDDGEPAGARPSSRPRTWNDCGPATTARRCSPKPGTSSPEPGRL
jgi:hypothetical protein